ncbi:Hpt protein [Solidesulfovibrio fructosivorans JJ]]|uniref:Hpt protein n=1 Tax=Solidesulfovibrio fructosivorans JJ] TaxID=596151 RepID=E1K1L2_SOLFR|nr:Hpt domain-containing protein [Solidesulfovibrio fructosivorans]EFL49506.1 Hpt protein [Solidesulfovibrio fructosivorans JJ]]
MTAASADIPPHTVAVSAELRPIFDRFLAIQREHTVDLERALAARDSEDLSRLAHTIRGSTATFQLPEAADMALALEEAVANADFAAAGRLIAALARYFHETDIVFVDARNMAATVASKKKSP